MDSAAPDRYHYWCDVVETTPPEGATQRTYRGGRKHAAVTVPVPLWVVRLLHRLGVRRSRG